VAQAQHGCGRTKKIKRVKSNISLHTIGNDEKNRSNTAEALRMAWGAKGGAAFKKIKKRIKEKKIRSGPADSAPEAFSTSVTTGGQKEAKWD